MSAVGFWTIALLIIYNANFGVCQFEEPVPFPPALPTPANIWNICRYGSGRKRYPPGSIPSNWSSHFRRRATAMNRLESWYGSCCRKGPDVCCAQQAWMKALDDFCTDEKSVKTVAYDCCRREGFEVWRCFSTDPANPDYIPIRGYRAPILHEPGFAFNVNECMP